MDFNYSRDSQGISANPAPQKPQTPEGERQFIGVPPVVDEDQKSTPRHDAKDHPHKKTSITHKIIYGLIFVVFLLVLYIVFNIDRFGAAVSVVAEDKVTSSSLSNTYFDFGSLSPGMSATRKINVKNEGIIPIRVIVLKGGDLKSSIWSSKNTFRLSTDSNMDIEFKVDVSEQATIGTTIFGKITLIKIPFF